MIMDVLLDLRQFREQNETERRSKVEDFWDTSTGWLFHLMFYPRQQTSSYVIITLVRNQHESPVFFFAIPLSILSYGPSRRQRHFSMPCLTKADVKIKNQTKRSLRARPPPLTLFYRKLWRWRAAIHSFVLSMLGEFPTHTYRLQWQLCEMVT